MAIFTEKMEQLTNELRTATRERASFVSNVQEHTHRHLADAKAFLGGISQEHVAMAERLKGALAADRQEQSVAVNNFRNQTRDQLQEMRKRLQEMLARTRQERQEKVVELRKEFRDSQDELARDLKQAAQVWSGFTRTTLLSDNHPRGESVGSFVRNEPAVSDHTATGQA